MASTLRGGHVGRSIRSPNPRSTTRREARALRSVGGWRRRSGGRVLRALRRRLFRLFVRHVMADDAAANRAHNAVMTGIVAGDAADDRAFHAALRLSRGGPHGGSRDQGEHHGGDCCKSHNGVPLFQSGQVIRRSEFGLAAWQGPGEPTSLVAAPVRAAIVAIRLARAYTTVFLSSLIL